MLQELLSLIRIQQGEHGVHPARGVDHAVQESPVQPEKPPFMAHVQGDVQAHDLPVVFEGAGKNLHVQRIYPLAVAGEDVAFAAVLLSLQTFQNGLRRSAMATVFRASASGLHPVRIDAAQGLPRTKPHKSVPGSRREDLGKRRIAVHDLAAAIGEKNHDRQLVQQLHLAQPGKAFGLMEQRFDGKPTRGRKISWQG